MALLKQITLPSNATASYHRIAGVEILDRQKALAIHLESFTDQETREELNGDGTPRFEPIAKPVVVVRDAAFDKLFGAGTPDYPDKTHLYEYIKTEPDFAGATDV